MKLNLSKFPLFLVLIPLITGIISDFYFCVHPQFYLSVLIPLIVYLIISFKKFSGVYPYRATMTILISLFAGGLLFSVKDYRWRKDSISAFYDKEVIVEGEIIEQKIQPGDRQQLLVEVSGVLNGDESKKSNGKVVVDIQSEKIFKVGDLILAEGRLDPFSNRNNPGEFDAVSFYRNRKISAHIFASEGSVLKTGNRSSLNSILTEWRNYLCQKMEAELDGKFLGIAKALILGDRSDLDQDVMRSFSTTGSMHVLAVSGLHIGLILMIFRKFLSVFSNRITRRQSTIIALLMIWVYGGLTGASPAVMRAVMMFSILSVGELNLRMNQSLNNLALSAIVLLAFDPWMLFDLGFQLSYCAMLGIFLLYRPIVDSWSPRHNLIRLGWEGTAVGIAATIVTTPLTLLWFYRFPNYFALANIGVMIFGFAVLLVGLILLAVSWLSYIVKIVALLFSFSVIGLVVWVDWVDSLPGSVSGGFHLAAWEAFAAFCLVLLWILHLDRKVIPRIALLGASVLLIGWWSFKRNEVINEDQLVVFNDNRFCIALKQKDRIVAFYDSKYSGSWKEPREIDAYAAYTGAEVRKFRIEHDSTGFHSGKDDLKIVRVKNGFSLSFNGKKWFYAYGGTPECDHDRRLMTTRLQQYLDPDKPTEPFVYDF